MADVSSLSMEDFKNIIMSVISQDIPEEGQIISTEMINSIRKDLNSLIQIKTDLTQLGYYLAAQNKSNQKYRSQLVNILGEKKATFNTAQLQQDLQNQKNVNNIANLILQAYHITTSILSKIGLISDVKYTFAYADEDSYMWADDLVLDEKDYYLELRNNASIAALRLQESSMKAKVLSSNNKNMQWQDVINQHWKDFISPYIAYQNRNNTGWTINYGTASEAFQSHLEMSTHTFDPLVGYNQGGNQHFGSKGDRWQLYRHAQASSPYFTGPDTQEAQIKNVNASIISNVDTVLNTLETILYLFNETHLKTLTLTQLQKAFSQTQSHVDRISTQLWQGFTKTEQKLYAKAVGGENATVKQLKKDIKIISG